MAGEWCAKRFARVVILVQHTVRHYDVPGFPCIGLEHICEGIPQRRELAPQKMPRPTRLVLALRTSYSASCDCTSALAIF